MRYCFRAYAAIKPISLAPEHIDLLQLAKQHQVNFGLSLVPDDRIEATFDILLSLDGIEQSFNATNYTPINKRPLAVYIKTKKPGDGWDKAYSQLVV